MASPLRTIMNIRREELPLSLLMFSYFFLVITSFWILKPIKKSVFIQFYDQTGFDLFSWHLRGSQAELLAKVLNMVVAFCAVAIFTYLARKFRRQQLTFIFCAFFVFGYIAFLLVINNPTDLTIWSFYLFGDLFSTLMVGTFFAFLNDSVTPDSARRLYGLVGLGGVTGGAFGSSFVRMWVEQVSISSWLWICIGFALLIAGISAAAGRLVEKNPPPEKPELGIDTSRPTGNPALEGARLVLGSRYLLSVVAIVGLYEIVSTVMDFQFTATIEHYLDGPAIGKQFSTVYSITNWVSMLVQVFLTSFIMTRFGLKTALMVLPVVILAGSAGFLIAPVLWMGSLLNTADNGFSYSINQSAKEALYVPTTRDEKYKAKAFIDMFVMRFAKAIAVGVSLAITSIFTEFSSIRWLSFVTAAIVSVWIIAVLFAGSQFRMKTSGGDEE